MCQLQFGHCAYGTQYAVGLVLRMRRQYKTKLEAASRRLASANAESAEAVAVQARAIVEELNTSAAAATAQRIIDASNR